MKIDILHHNLNYSGSSIAAIQLSNNLVKEGVTTKLVVLGSNPDEKFDLSDKVIVKFLGVDKRNSIANKIKYPLSSLWDICKYLRTEEPKNIIVTAKELTLITLLARIITRHSCKIIGISATHISSQLKNKITTKLQKLIYRQFLPTADHIIAISNGMITDLMQNYNIPEEKITLIYPMLSNHFFADNPPDYKPDGEILFAGRMDENKSPHTAIDILSLLKAKDIKLRMIGNGSLLEEVKIRVENENLANKVLIEGSKPDIMPYLKKSSVLILTSKYEGFGMVLVESIACGVPVISFDCPTGPAEIIINGENGYLIPPGDINLFAQMLDKTLDQEWDYKKIMQSANKFHPDVVIKQYLEVIEKHLS